ncbi:putative membrane protein [Clostridium bornimense]|uniref:Putative membrane protein n=1 Tax=Clostridium bornimense TaxID=1216932 RepID=W6S150_9CLOT|nr:YcxB family protein [Clostridium bornimense]CDM70448.1 putative membrane protein [Clostridium bornimense]
MINITYENTLEQWLKCYSFDAFSSKEYKRKTNIIRYIPAILFLLASGIQVILLYLLGISLIDRIMSIFFTVFSFIFLMIACLFFYAYPKLSLINLRRLLMEMISNGDILVNEQMKVSIDNEYITIDNRYYKRTIKLSSIYNTKIIEDLFFINLKGGLDLIIPFDAVNNTELKNLKNILDSK